ncbi:MAG: hypothetical protein WB870_06500 [Gallionellaceae bacterium]
MKPITWRANPDEETTDWRARCGKTAHRVRREGTVIAVPYPYLPGSTVPAVIKERSEKLGAIVIVPSPLNPQQG